METRWNIVLNYETFKTNRKEYNRLFLKKQNVPAKALFSLSFLLPFSP